MIGQPDLLGVLDTAYHVEGTDDAWLQSLVDALERATEAELGCIAFFLDVSDLNQTRVEPAKGSPRAPAFDMVSMTANASEAELSRFYRTSPVGTSSMKYGQKEWPRKVAEVASLLPTGVKDMIGVLALDASRRGCVLTIPLSRFTRLKRDEVRRFAHLSAHIAAALRVRRALAGEPMRADLGRGTEALLDPGGRVLDAEGVATDCVARAELRQMARVVDRARTRLRRKNADLALDAWTALVSGRWTLLDHFDTDGRRFVVARKNPPDLAEPLALDPRERMVASAIALGHPQKLVSYELGLPALTVSRLVRSALRKLGLQSPAELASVLASFVPERSAGRE